MNWEIQIGAEKVKVSLPDRIPEGSPFEARVNGKAIRCLFDRVGRVLYLVGEDGSERPVQIRAAKVVRHQDSPSTEVAAELVEGAGLASGFKASVQPDLPANAGRAKSQAAKGSVVRSPITGKVLAVKVELGKTVEAGEALLVIEAMKMENRIFAPVSGTVTEIKVQEGQAVTVGAELLRLT